LVHEGTGKKGKKKSRKRRLGLVEGGAYSAILVNVGIRRCDMQASPGARARSTSEIPGIIERKKEGEVKRGERLRSCGDVHGR